MMRRFGVVPVLFALIVDPASAPFPVRHGQRSVEPFVIEAFSSAGVPYKSAFSKNARGVFQKLGPRGYFTMWPESPLPLSIHWTLFLGIIAGPAFYKAVHAIRLPLDASTLYFRGLIYTVVILLSFIIHEYGHAIVAILRGTSVLAIKVHLTGGSMNPKQPYTLPWDSIWISLAGPVIQLFSAGTVAVFLRLIQIPELNYEPAVQAVKDIVLVALFNLLPFWPMDGGRLTAAFFWMRSNDKEQGIYHSAKLSIWLCGILFLGTLIAQFHYSPNVPTLVAVAPILLGLTAFRANRDVVRIKWLRYYQAFVRDIGDGSERLTLIRQSMLSQSPVDIVGALQSLPEALNGVPKEETNRLLLHLQVGFQKLLKSRLLFSEVAVQIPQTLAALTVLEKALAQGG